MADKDKSKITSSGTSGKPEYPNGTTDEKGAAPNGGWHPPVRGEAPYNKG